MTQCAYVHVIITSVFQSNKAIQKLPWLKLLRVCSPYLREGGGTATGEVVNSFPPSPPAALLPTGENTDRKSVFNIVTRVKSCTNSFLETTSRRMATEDPMEAENDVEIHPDTQQR